MCVSSLNEFNLMLNCIIIEGHTKATLEEFISVVKNSYDLFFKIYFLRNISCAVF